VPVPLDPVPLFCAQDVDARLSVRATSAISAKDFCIVLPLRVLFVAPVDATPLVPCEQQSQEEWKRCRRRIGPFKGEFQLTAGRFVAAAFARPSDSTILRAERTRRYHAPQLHSSLNGGSLTHGGMDELMAAGAAGRGLKRVPEMRRVHCCEASFLNAQCAHRPEHDWLRIERRIHIEWRVHLEQHVRIEPPLSIGKFREWAAQGNIRSAKGSDIFGVSLYVRQQLFTHAMPWIKRFIRQAF
jgi:hypothetical protein